MKVVELLRSGTFCTKHPKYEGIISADFHRAKRANFANKVDKIGENK